MSIQQKSKTLLALIIIVIVSLFAVTAFAQQDQTAASLKFVGRIDAVSNTTLTVNGQQIFYDNATIDADLTVGASVLIEGQLTSEHRIEATRITRANGDFLLPDEVRITGVLNDKNASTFDFGGKLIDSSNLNADAALNTGAIVRVFANTTASGAWSARRIQLMNNSSADLNANADLAADLNLLTQGRTQVVGTLDAATEDSITISGMTIDTTGADINGGLVPGALVNVWLDTDHNGIRAAAVSSADIDAQADTSAFIDLTSQQNADTSAQVGANANVGAGINTSSSNTSAGANANVSVNADAGTHASSGGTNSSASVNIDLGSGLSTQLGNP